jgi:hypothetical protein
MDLGNYQNSIPELIPLNNFRYENIFKMYQTKDNKYFYNIIKKIDLIPNLDPSQFFYFTIARKMPWTIASYNIYNTIELWWLLCLVNNINNPVIQPSAGTIIKALKSNLVAPLINNIKSQLS